MTPTTALRASLAENGALAILASLLHELRMGAYPDEQIPAKIDQALSRAGLSRLDDVVALSASPLIHDIKEDAAGVPAMSDAVRVSVPLNLTPKMLRAVRDSELTKFSDKAEWHAHLGWLMCAWEILLEEAKKDAAP